MGLTKLQYDTHQCNKVSPHPLLLMAIQFARQDVMAPGHGSPFVLQGCVSDGVSLLKSM